VSAGISPDTFFGVRGTFPVYDPLPASEVFPEPLIGDLAFITNKGMRPAHLRQAMREIPEEDYRLILRRAGITNA